MTSLSPYLHAKQRPQLFFEEKVALPLYSAIQQNYPETKMRAHNFRTSQLETENALFGFF